MISELLPLSFNNSVRWGPFAWSRHSWYLVRSRRKQQHSCADSSCRKSRAQLFFFSFSGISNDAIQLLRSPQWRDPLWCDFSSLSWSGSCCLKPWSLTDSGCWFYTSPEDARLHHACRVFTGTSWWQLGGLNWATLWRHPSLTKGAFEPFLLFNNSSSTLLKSL